jgi:2-oxoglutarate dehydrogenase E1 component
MTQPSSLAFLSNANPAFLQSLYENYAKNPDSVDASWRALFDDLRDEVAANNNLSPSWGSKLTVKDDDLDVPGPVVAKKDSKDKAAPADKNAPILPADAVARADAEAMVHDSIRALMLIRAYRACGHFLAKLDPLGLTETANHPELDYRTYGFSEADLDRTIYIDNVLGLTKPTLRQILSVLQQSYSGTIGFEFMHVQDPAAKSWLQERIEGTRPQNLFSAEEKKEILRDLTRAEGFEKYLHLKYTGTKRFGLDGGESVIAALEACLKTSAKLGTKEVVLGMAHRGRLNVLANIMDKPMVKIFSEFQGNAAHPDDVQGSGDVKYHLGTSVDRNIAGETVHLSLTANPSHLEAVNPVVVGKVRAKQALRGDKERKQVLAILLHGDAAFAGQGLVPETIGLSELKGYRTGGTMHFIVNNQIGFTTSPSYARSTPYSTDVAQMVKSPIFHVNGDDPEAVVWVSALAEEFRQTFAKDVVVDVLCYRRFGHNESDEPAFTQPKMYNKIAKQPSTRTLYAEKLIADGVLSQADVDAMTAAYNAQMDAAFDQSKTFKTSKADWLEGAWSGMDTGKDEEDRKGNTDVSLAVLKKVGQSLASVPATFDLNPKIKRQLQAKAAMFDTGEGFDWATAEALAFGTLLLEGYNVRLSGQDCGRGTFSQRHAVLHDQTNEDRYLPLNGIREGQVQAEIIDSPLAEASVLGFDYGYSLADPKTLVLWEAQFGDFVNGAQVIIDQFISSAESKWLRMCGLVMLLPHGFEGQGPEHSSARLERFLQACAEDNMQVANCSTPANYFHILRRQMRRNFRKPLIIMTPKSLLRHKLCVSSLADMGPNTSFHRVLPETDKGLVPDAKIRRVVLCSGKVYYDLFETRTAQKINDVAIVRVEQFYPFPHNSLKTTLTRYPNAEVIWCQEEPENMGAWTFLDRRIEGVLTDLNHKTKRPRYVGRPAAASPAVGTITQHNQQQQALVAEALGK